MSFAFSVPLFYPRYATPAAALLTLELIAFSFAETIMGRAYRVKQLLHSLRFYDETLPILKARLETLK